jgi:hypothetical protein
MLAVPLQALPAKLPAPILNDVLQQERSQPQSILQSHQTDHRR